MEEKGREDEGGEEQNEERKGFLPLFFIGVWFGEEGKKGRGGKNSKKTQKILH